METGRQPVHSPPNFYRKYPYKCNRSYLDSPPDGSTFASMKSAVRYMYSWFLLAAFLLGSTSLGELFKLPVLIEHFREHQQETPAITVLDFILLHYFSGSPRDADYERDMQLPFKTLELSSVSVSAIHFPPESAIFDITPVIATPRKALPPLALLSPPTPFVPTPSEPPEA